MVKVCTICVSYVFMYAVKCVMVCVKCSAYVCVYIRTTVVCGCLSVYIEKERGAMYIRCVSACSFVVYVHNVGVCTGIHTKLQAPSR